ncbi:MAG: hypothetical protein M3362_17240, partial [Acidobacteriota bacterium]|nr:hypothetical protein [Acidobacteriota bacterium]
MKLKLIVVLVALLTYLAVVLACNKQQMPTASLSSHPSTAAPAPPDGTDPPHAVYIDGKALPAESATQPDKPIILAKDIDDPKWGEMKPEAAFDHTKHTTDPNHSADGKTVTACVECHHTEQPSSTIPYLKKFERKEVLTAKVLEAPNAQPVKSCRTCHFSSTSEETDEYPPKSITYPAAMNRQPSG